mmetsp:Transcript_97819/g.281047  ORF Transcript_97819/g.281047 Transcript_97819/m.281047 type:complete len:258 (+) Transcript_97819:550-1323(+)
MKSLFNTLYGIDPLHSKLRSGNSLRKTTGSNVGSVSKNGNFGTTRTTPACTVKIQRWWMCPRYTSSTPRLISVHFEGTATKPRLATLGNISRTVIGCAMSSKMWEATSRAPAAAPSWPPSSRPAGSQQPPGAASPSTPSAQQSGTSSGALSATASNTSRVQGFIAAPTSKTRKWSQRSRASWRRNMTGSRSGPETRMEVSSARPGARSARSAAKSKAKRSRLLPRLGAISPKRVARPRHQPSRMRWAGVRGRVQDWA